MIRLSDQPTAQYFFVGETRAPRGLKLGGINMESFRVYLGVLTPSALARIGQPRVDERLGNAASVTLHTLFDGVRGGSGVIQEGAVSESLPRLLAEATRQQYAVESDARFRQALLSVRHFREPQCLAFELTWSMAGAIGVGISVQTRVDQPDRGHGQISFFPHQPVRILTGCGSGMREFKLQVG